jgi:hypothetical protein
MLAGDPRLRPRLCRRRAAVAALGGWQVISWALVLSLPVMTR